jgi:F-type H+-transporting ATPase subunit a
MPFVNRIIRGIFAALILSSGQFFPHCAGAASVDVDKAVAAAVVTVPESAAPEVAEAKESIPVAPEVVFTIPLGEKGLPITNSILMSWIVSIGLIAAFRIAISRPKLVPGRAQAAVEAVIEALRDLLEMIVGPKMIGKTFPLLIGLFTFILIQNWCGLIPGVGSIGFHEGGKFVPLLRPANADLNMTLGLTLVHFVAWTYFVMRYAGPKVLFLDLFGNKAPKGELPAPLYMAMFVMFGLVGLIEVISLVFRNVSLPFRLFGNIFGGDNLMSSMMGWGIPIPFYFMELLVGLVQALVFTILVSVYIGQICNHEEEHAAH